ncbi:MAG: hypothetical protein FK730_03370 [Asgard group archaeon]|nr:hypothetical protein [Asgard group archaeon]
MSNNHYRKINGALIIALFLSSGIMVTFATGYESSKFLSLVSLANIQKKSLFQLDFEGKSQDLEDILLPYTKEVLSNTITDLDLRYELTLSMEKYTNNERAVLFLIASEISSAYNGHVQMTTAGYLVTIDFDWAIVIEHGYHLLSDSNLRERINRLSSTYSNVLLASCDSNVISRFYKNVYGFSGKITVENIINYLKNKIQGDEKILQSIVQSKLKTYELWVSADFFDVESIAAINALILVDELNTGFKIPPSFNYDIIQYFHGIQLEDISPFWGVQHINKKCDAVLIGGGGYGTAIDNTLIQTILNDIESIAAVFDVGGSYGCIVVLYRKGLAVNLLNGAIYDSACVTICVRPDLPIEETHLTIITADVAHKRETNAEKPNCYAHHLTKEAKDRKNIKKIFGWSFTLALSSSPYEIAEIEPNYDVDIDPAIKKQTREIVFKMITYLLFGWPMLLVYEKFNDDIIDWVGEGTYLYYLVWICIIQLYITLVMLLALAIALIICFWPVILAMLPEIAIAFGVALLCAGVNTTPFYFALLEGSDTNTLTQSNNAMLRYDDDNDAIPNYIEFGYFMKYINGTPDEPFYINDKNTWLDPEIDYDNDGLSTYTEYIVKSDPFLIDTDNDTLNDNQEVIINGSPFTMTANFTDNNKDGYLDTQTVSLQGSIEFQSNPNLFDSDHDGLGDKEEIIYGTEKLDWDSDNDSLLDGWEIFASEIGWVNGPIDDSDIINHLDPPDDPNWVNLDLDGDSLTNSEESFYFTDPDSDDTDQDGLRDDWEIDNNLDPTNPDDGNFDHDNDTLPTNLEVNTYQTDWLNNDTDFDNLLDGEEINIHNTNPLACDTDGDFIDDYEEINVGTDGYITNPTDADTDGDGLIDSDEIDIHSTNPVEYDTDSDAIGDYTELYIFLTEPLVPDSDNDGLLDGDEVYIHFTDPNNFDSDNDGLTDGEELNTYFTDPLNPDSDTDFLDDGDEINTYNTDPNDNDSDNDGLKDGHEVNVHGTDPLNDDTDDDGLLDGEEYVTYGTDFLDSDSDDDGWTDYYEVFTSLTDPNLDDTDNDGLLDSVEQSYNTDPNIADCDSDGLLDGEEVTIGSDGYITDPNDSDSDNDNLTDGQEDIYNTNPNKSDTDSDGWSDIYEINTSGTNPRKADTDSDGLTDKNEFNYWKYTRGRTTSQAYAYCKDSDVDNDNLKDGTELSVGCDPLDADSDNDGLFDGYEEYTYGTDPTDYDSDNDGYSDGEEIAAGTDPNDPDDHPGGGGGGFGW